MLRVFALVALAVSACAYPLDLPREWTRALFGPANPEIIQRGFLPAIRACFEFAYRPLVLKEVLTSWIILSMAGLWVTWKALGGRRRSDRAFPGDQGPPPGAREYDRPG